MKLLATIQKDVRTLLRDKVGLVLMFAMPILLVIIVTGIQNNTFDLANENKISLLICNKDSGRLSSDFIHALDTIGMFNPSYINHMQQLKILPMKCHAKDVAISIVIEQHFSNQIASKAKSTAGKALNSFGLEGDTITSTSANQNSLSFYYNPAISAIIKAFHTRRIKKRCANDTKQRSIKRSLFFNQ